MVNWKINQAELTEKYCENKAKPMLHCNGKCYLAKQLKIQEELDKANFDKESKKQQPKFKKIKESELFSRSYPPTIEIEILSESQKNRNLNQPENYIFESIDRCFQPPQLS